MHYFWAHSRDVQMWWVTHLFIAIGNLSWNDNSLQACDTIFSGEEDAKFYRYAQVFANLPTASAEVKKILRAFVVTSQR